MATQRPPLERSSLDIGVGPRTMALARASHAGAGAEADDNLMARVLDAVRLVDGSKAPFRRMWRWLRLERRDLLALVAYAVVVGALSLATPVAVQALIHTVTFATLLQPLLVLGGMLTAGLALAAVLLALQTWVVELLSRRVFLRVVEDFAARLPRLRHDALPGQHAPELVNRFFDVVTIEKTIATLLTDGLAATLQIAAGMLLLALYHPFLLVFDLVLVALLLLVLAGLGQGALQSAVKESKLKYRNADWLQTIARHELLFKGHSGRTWADREAEELARSWLAARRKHFAIVMRQFAGLLALEVVASAGLMTLGGWLVIDRQLSLGQLVAAEIVVAATVLSVRKVGKLLGKFYDLLAAVDKIGVVLDLPLERDGGEALPAGAGGLRVRLSAVRTRTPGGLTRPPVSLELAAGEHVALTAYHGGGRRALTEVLLGLREPVAGAVEVEGLDLRDLDLASVRECAALVQGAALGRADLLPRSVFDNVAQGRPLGRGAVRQALEELGLGPTITALPDGLDTVLDVDGDPLGRDALGLLALARVLVAPPRLLVIDRALDVLSPPARTQALAALLAPSRPWTVLCVTDLDEVARRCGRVIEMPGEHPLAAAPGLASPPAWEAG